MVGICNDCINKLDQRTGVDNTGVASTTITALLFPNLERDFVFSISVAFNDCRSVKKKRKRGEEDNEIETPENRPRHTQPNVILAIARGL